MARIDRQQRARERRERAILRRTDLEGAARDLRLVRGAEALSLVTRLTRESWSAAGLEVPRYGRAETPYRFVAGHGT